MAIVDATSLLKFSNSDDLLQFLHLCVDDLIGKNTVNIDNFNNEIELSKDELKKAQRYVKVLLQNLAINPGNDLKMDLNDNVKEAIKKCLEIRKEEIENYVKTQNIKDSGLLLVQNLDWKLKWIIGSSTFATICEPLLQVDLYCLSKENKRKNINFEMNLEQVERMIEELELVKTKIK